MIILMRVLVIKFIIKLVILIGFTNVDKCFGFCTASLDNAGLYTMSVSSNKALIGYVVLR